MSKNTGKIFSAVFVSYILFSYPLFYFTYKYGSPDVGSQTDFYSYYQLYDKWDLSKVESPFNMRLVSTFVVHLLSKANFFYDTHIAYHHHNISQQIFFDALFVNYISVVLTCLIICYTIYHFYRNYFFAFGIGLLYLLGFGTIFFEITPLTDSFSVFLLATAFHCYLKKSKWIILFLFMSVLQREYTLLTIGLVAIIEYLFLRSERKYNLTAFLFSILFFLIYFFLRTTYFYTPTRYSIQTNIYSYFYISEIIPYIRQSFMMQNLLFAYFIVIIYKKIAGKKINKLYFLITIGLLLQIVTMPFVGGNNAGRIFYMTSPMILFYLASEIKPLLEKYLIFDDEKKMQPNQ